jgi:hypothetical protein
MPRASGCGEGGSGSSARPGRRGLTGPGSRWASGPASRVRRDQEGAPGGAAIPHPGSGRSPAACPRQPWRLVPCVVFQHLGLHRPVAQRLLCPARGTHQSSKEGPLGKGGSPSPRPTRSHRLQHRWLGASRGPVVIAGAGLPAWPGSPSGSSTIRAPAAVGGAVAPCGSRRLDLPSRRRCACGWGASAALRARRSAGHRRHSRHRSHSHGGGADYVPQGESRIRPRPDRGAVDRAHPR